MNVSLSPELEQFVAAKLSTGFYSSASEVIREGLRLLIEQDAIKQQRIAQLNVEIDKGLASVAAGRLISGEEAFRQLRERHDAYVRGE